MFILHLGVGSNLRTFEVIQVFFKQRHVDGGKINAKCKDTIPAWAWNEERLAL